MSTIDVKAWSPGIRVELFGVYPDEIPHDGTVRDIGITLTRDEATELHAKLGAALGAVREKGGERR